MMLFSFWMIQGMVWSTISWAQPPVKIRPDQSYYSDEFKTQGQVSNIGNEKNYEEVYQLYEYYEAIYDKEGRVAVFKAYQKGQVIRTERYAYSSQGKLIKQTTIKPGLPEQIKEY